MPEHLVHQLGQLPTDLGALVEPIAVSFHAVRLSRIGPGQTAVVFRAGPIGLATLMCLRVAGFPATFQGAIRTVKRGGTVVNIAIWGHPVELNPNDLVLSEVILVGSICYNRDHPATIRLMQDGRIDTGGLITTRLVGYGW